MRQFYEAYREDQKVSPLVTQLSWSHHLIILGQSKRPEEREFYLRLAIRERWSKRELERQFKTALFERAVLSLPKVSPLVTQMYPEALNVFRDAYTVEFLGSPQLKPKVRIAKVCLEEVCAAEVRTAAEWALQIQPKDSNTSPDRPSENLNG